MKQLDNNFTFAIVGNGISGWLSALFLKKKLPKSNVIVISSSKSDETLEAEGGTNYEFVKFLQELNISIRDVIRESKCTFKLGTKFTNWNDDGETYFSQFSPITNFSETRKDVTIRNISTFCLENVAKENPVNDFLLYSKLSEKNLLQIEDKETLGQSSFKRFVPKPDYAIHFDTTLLTQFLEKVGNSRGINLINDNVDGIISDDDGYITALKLKSGGIQNLDFVFDCSGFNKTIIGNHFKSNWISVEKHLPVNTITSFFLENDSTNIPPYTEAVAMNYGWMWKIPVQGGFGCGYVYDSQYLNEEEAKKEVEDVLNKKINIRNTHNFNAGYFETPWVKNCISIGSSSSFFEPIEETPISIQTFSLNFITKCLTGISNRDPNAIEIYNNRLTKFYYNTLNSHYLHYLTKRINNEFWKRFYDPEIQPDLVKNTLNIISFSLPDAEYTDRFRGTQFFVIPVWYMVMSGLKLIPQDVANTFFKTLIYESSHSNYEEDKQKIIDYINAVTINSGIQHHDYINYVLSDYD
jgi:hypothetical protein